MRRPLIVTGLAAGAALLLDTLLWLLGTGLLGQGASRWIDQAQAHGWAVSASGRTAGGWPFVASISADKIAVSGGERQMPGGLAWSADHIVMSVSLAHPLTLRIAAEGQQFLRLSHAPDIGFTAASAVAWLPLVRGRGVAVNLLAVGISGGIAGSRHPQDVQVASVSIRLRVDQPIETATAASDLPTARLDVRAAGIGLPDIGRWPLGATIAEAGAAIVLASPKLQGQDGGRAQAAEWRDGGGKLSVRGAALRWGPLALHADADLALDGRLQPAGEGAADIAGTGPALDAAVSGGLVPQGLALTTQAVLAVMAHVPGPGGTDAVRIPFRLRNSTISVGNIPVAQLPQIAWRSTAP